MKIVTAARALAIAGTLLCASSTWAVMIQGGAFNGTDVGGLDPLVSGAQADNSTISGLCGPGGSPTVETCWANTFLSGLTYNNSKTENVTAYATDTANVIAFQLPFGGDHFLLKNATWSALFQNLDKTGWGVVDISGLNSGFNLNANGGVISHVTEFNPTSVPEPGPVALLGVGLLVLGLRKMRGKMA